MMAELESLPIEEIACIGLVVALAKVPPSAARDRVIEFHQYSKLAYEAIARGLIGGRLMVWGNGLIEFCPEDDNDG